MFKISAITFEDIGSATSDPGTQWATFSLGFMRDADTHQRLMKITTKVPRLRGTTMEQIVEASGAEAIEMLKAAIATLQGTSLPDLLA